MANTFYRGETAIIMVKLFDSVTGLPTDPDTITISVYDNENGPEVENQDMLKDGTGEYHYDVDTSDIGKLGVCVAIITAVTGERIAKEKTYFMLRPLLED